MSPVDPPPNPAGPPRGVAADRTEDGSFEGPRSGPPRVGPYRLEALLGRGGMGEVYRAFDPRLHRHVAVKRILPGRHAATAQARFWREARALAALRHPDLVAIHDIGEDEGGLYLAMELVAGTPLSELLGAAWTPTGALALVAQVARALGAAHAAGIVHRDIKPSNIIVQPDGRGRVVDFGLARRASDDDRVTAGEAMVGTVSYMAPEQVSGEPTTPATDVHALGSVLYALLTREPPHGREAREATVLAILGSVHRRLDDARRDLPAAVVELVERCLAVDPARRPADGSALADAIEAAAVGLTRPLGQGAVSAELALVAQGSSAPLVDTARALPAGPAASAPHPSSVASASAAATPAPSAPRHRRRAVVVALAALGVVAALLAWRALWGAAPAVALGARPTLAIWPLVGASAASPVQAGDLMELGGLVAAGLREYASGADGALAVLDPRELERRGDDSDLVVTGALEVDGGMATAELLVTAPEGGRELRLRASAPRRDPLALARALFVALADELDVAVPALPTITTSKDAWRALVRAREANLLGHFRAVESALTDADRADPGLVAAKVYRAEMEEAYGRIEAAKVLVKEVLERRGEVSARDASLAGLLDIQLDPSRGAELGAAVDAHLKRWPHDLEVRLTELHMRFTARGSGRLGEAIPHAEELLDAAPSIPTVASKLVRALAWTGRVDDVAERLAAHGITDAMADMRVVLGEAALYRKDYAGALALFRADRSDDGQVPYYGLHMAIAAELLSGDATLAAGHAKARIEAAVGSGKPLWIDWTYYLWFNTLVASGQLEAALLACDEWANRVGTTRAANTYGGWRWEVRLLMEPDPRGVLDEVHAALLAPDGGGLMVSVYPLLARIETDTTVLDRAIAAIEDRLGKRLGNAPVVQAETLMRLQRGLEARRAMLAGRTDEALATYASLARLEGQDATSEGDLFAKARWMRTWAEALDQAGRRDEAERVWRELLDLGYERLLTMETTVAAKRRLGLVK